jgi:putative ABC transport system permease protein
VRHAVTLATQEVRGSWRRNLVKGAILLGAIGTQLFTSLAAEASEQAVASYGAAVFGYEQTYRADLETPPTLAQLATMDATLDREVVAHPAAVVVLQASVGAGLTSRTAPVGGPETVASISSFHGAWTEVSATMAGAPGFAEVAGADALPRLLVSGQLADRLGVSPTALVTVTVSGAAPPPTGSGEVVAGPDEGGSAAPRGEEPSAPGGEEPSAPEGEESPTPEAGTDDGGAQSPLVVPDIPAHRGPVEPNKALVNDVLASRSLLHLMGAAPESASIYWRCAAPECADTAGLAEDVARTGGFRLAEGLRIDSHDELTPVLHQQREQGALFAWVALGLGAVAVAIVGTAMVEVRTPELVTLRTLGATRSTLFAAALVEGLVVAVAVGALSMVASLALARLDPDLLNHIDAVELTRFDPPLDVYLRTGTVTVLVGLLTGLLPDLRDHRLVRAS